MKTLFTMIMLATLLIAKNSYSAPVTVETAANEEICLEIAGDNEELIDQCMDQAYESDEINATIATGDI